MNVENVGHTVALIVDDSKPKSNQLLSVEPKKENVITFLKDLKLKDNQRFQHIPNINMERNILYITAPSGQGKSYYTKQYADQYRKIYPKREIYLFSSLTDDSSIDKIKNLRRIKLSPEFLNEDFSAKDFSESLIIFDDTDCITDKRMKQKINGILHSLLETGRHFSSSVIFTRHIATAGHDTKKILNECHSVTIFCNGMGGKSKKYLLDQYLGLDKHQIKRLTKLESRWVTIMKTYPMICLSEKEAFVLNSNDEDE